MAQAGVRRAVYTDIQRDGMLTGVNVPATVQLAERSGLKVIASGGVRGLDDIATLRDFEAAGIEGVIIGQALYTGTLDLRQALALAATVATTVGPVTQS
jgi:phosphoribosylformimino-5-aminoimidazole carboxamide ribotide isomerase